MEVTGTPGGRRTGVRLTRLLDRTPRRLVIRTLTRLDPETWAHLHTGQRLRVRLGTGVGRSIWLRHFYEPDVEENLRRVLRPGNTFIDAGANVGYFSLVASQIVGEGGEIHAFEPGALAYALLLNSIAANGLRNVWCHQIALWSDDADLDLVFNQDSAYRYVRRKAMSADQLACGVSLDRYAARVVIRRPIHLVKIDIEGAEVEALRGMRDILATDRPTLIVEGNDPALARFGHSLEDIFAELQAHGYTATDLDGGPLKDPASARAAIASRVAPNLLFSQPR